jgi:1,4-dihydroxy-2-naphthoate octaprenyltransferase
MGLRVWWQAVQPHSFIASIVPVLLGAVIAWTRFGAALNVLTFALTVMGVLAIHAATNMSNDYVDFRRGVDDLPPELITPFTGGSRVLPDGLVEPAAHRRVFLSLYSLGAVVGVALALMVRDGWVILLLGWIAGPLTFLYTYPPLSLQYRGLGEILVGLVFGPVLVFGSFFVQASVFAWEPVVVSVPIGLVVAAFLVVNEIPERETDPKGGKQTIPSRLGLTHSVWFFASLMLGAFAWIVVAVILSSLPPVLLLSLLASPLALKAVDILRRTGGKFPDHLPANGLTILTALILGLLLVAAYVASRTVLA